MASSSEKTPEKRKRTREEIEEEQQLLDLQIKQAQLRQANAQATLVEAEVTKTTGAQGGGTGTEGAAEPAETTPKTKSPSPIPGILHPISRPAQPTPRRKKEEPEREVPLSFIVSHMPADYAGKKLVDNVRSMVAVSDAQNNLRLICDLDENQGAVGALVGAFKDIKFKEKSQTVKLSSLAMATPQQGKGASAPEVEVSPSDVAGLMQSLLFGTVVDLGAGSPFDEVKLNSPSLFGPLFRDDKFKGMFSARERERKEDGKPNPLYRKVTVADALALYMYLKETDRKKEAKALNDIILKSMRERLYNWEFRFNAYDGTERTLVGMKTELIDNGVDFNEHLTEALGWHARNAAVFTKLENMRTSKRYHPKRIWAILGEHYFAANRAEREKARSELARYSSATGESLKEIKDRGDVSTYGKDLGQVLNKAFDDSLISKKEVLGATNPEWKTAVYKTIAEDMRPWFFEMRNDRISYGYDENMPGSVAKTPYFRHITHMLWDRVGNVLVRDTRNPDPNRQLVLNEGLAFRDGFVKDLEVEGAPTQHDAVKNYLKRTYGHVNEDRIRGWGLLINDVWGAHELQQFSTRLEDNRVVEAQKLSCLDAVNKERDIGHKPRANTVDELTAEDLTPSVVAASGVSTLSQKGLEDDEKGGGEKLAADRKKLMNLIRDSRTINNVLSVVNTGRQKKARFIEEVTREDVLDASGRAKDEVINVSGFVERANERIIKTRDDFVMDVGKACSTGQMQVLFSAFPGSGKVTKVQSAKGNPYQFTVTNEAVAEGKDEPVSTRYVVKIIGKAEGSNECTIRIVREDDKAEKDKIDVEGTLVTKDGVQMVTYGDDEMAFNRVVSQVAVRKGITPDKADATVKFFEREDYDKGSLAERTRRLAGNELVDSLAYTTLMEDTKTGIAMFMQTFYRKAGLDQDIDNNLRYRTMFRGGFDNRAAKPMLKYMLRDIACMPDDELMPYGAQVSPEEADAIRKYAFALKDDLTIVCPIMNSTQYQGIFSPDKGSAEEAAQMAGTVGDMMIGALTPVQKMKIQALTNDSTIDGKALTMVLVKLNDMFTAEQDRLVKWGVETGTKKSTLDNLDATSGTMAQERFFYDKVWVMQAFKESAPPGTPEDKEDYWGRVRTAQLIGKYKAQLKPLRAHLKNAYAPIGFALAVAGKDDFGADIPVVVNGVQSTVDVERDKVIRGLMTDLFGVEGKDHFARIGAAVKTKAFQEWCKAKSLDVKAEDTKDQKETKIAQQQMELEKNKGANWQFGELSSYEAARRVYLYMQEADAWFGTLAEHYDLTNSYGMTIPPIETVVHTDDLLDGIMNPSNIRNHLRVQPHGEAVKDGESPKEPGHAYRNTVVAPGLIVDGLWPSERLDIQLLTQEPYMRGFMMNVARCQSAYEDSAKAVEQGAIRNNLAGFADVLDTNGVSEKHTAWSAIRAYQDLSEKLDGDVPVSLDEARGILDAHNLPKTHEAYRKLTAGTGVDAKEVATLLSKNENMLGLLGDIRGNSLSITAAEYGVAGDMRHLGDVFKYYGEGVIAQHEGRLNDSENAFKLAYSSAEDLKYGGGAVDFRVHSLNARGWVKKSVADQMAPVGVQKWGKLQSSLDDFTAAWLISRGESPGLVLDENRKILDWDGPVPRLPRLERWWNNRFSYSGKERVVGENAEAMAAMGLVNNDLGAIASLQSKTGKSRALKIGTGAAAVAAGSTVATVVSAGITAPVGLPVAAAASAVSAASYGVVAFTERRWLANSWARRAHKEIGAYDPAALDPMDARSYIHASEQRTVGLIGAETLAKSADNGWLDGLRGSHITYNMDPALGMYRTALKMLDPVTCNQILHTYRVEVPGADYGIDMRHIFVDTLAARRLKRETLESLNRYTEASWGALTQPVWTEAEHEANPMAGVYDRAEKNHRIRTVRRNNWSRIWDVISLGSLLPWGTRAGERDAVTGLKRYIKTHPDEVKDAPPGCNNRSAKLLEKLGDTGLAAEQAEKARGKWGERYQKNQPVPQELARLDLITDVSDRLSGLPSTVVYK